jgi:hypothetical protein
MTIKERANNKIHSKIMHANIYIEDLRHEFKSGIFRGNITSEEMNGLIESAKIELDVLNYIYKLIELDNE